MTYQVLARKWRPAAFDTVVGQEPITRTLKNALVSGRVAHAYLFTGPRGVGKTTTARLLAKALCCPARAGAEACGACPSCQDFVSGAPVDVLEIDAASNTSVDDIRTLRDNVKYAPARGRFKVYIVDEVHMLSGSAFNAFLKTLEEPPPHVVFILATTEPKRIPATVLSRCQRFDFKPIPPESLQAAGAASTADELIYLLRAFLEADGEMRRSPHPRVELEIAAVRATRRPEPQAVDTLLAKVEEALTRLRGSPGGAPGPGAGPRPGAVQESLLVPRAPAAGPGSRPGSPSSETKADRVQESSGSRADEGGLAEGWQRAVGEIMT